MPVIQLLDLVGKYLGLSYVYNPDEIKGEVSLKLNGDLHGQIRVSQLYPLLEQSLRQVNLITTRYKGNVVSIVPAARMLEVDPPLIDRSTRRVESGDTVVSCKFELKYIDTAAAKSLLDGMKVSDNVIAVPEKHMLMVTTYAYRMERVERLLQMIDQPGERKKFQLPATAVHDGQGPDGEGQGDGRADARGRHRHRGGVRGRDAPRRPGARAKTMRRIGPAWRRSACSSNSSRPLCERNSRPCAARWGRRRPSRASTSMPTSGPTVS